MGGHDGGTTQERSAGAMAPDRPTDGGGPPPGRQAERWPLTAPPELAGGHGPCRSFTTPPARVSRTAAAGPPSELPHDARTVTRLVNEDGDLDVSVFYADKLPEGTACSVVTDYNQGRSGGSSTGRASTRTPKGFCSSSRGTSAGPRQRTSRACSRRSPQSSSGMQGRTPPGYGRGAFVRYSGSRGSGGPGPR